MRKHAEKFSTVDVIFIQETSTQDTETDLPKIVANFKLVGYINATQTGSPGKPNGGLATYVRKNLRHWDVRDECLRSADFLENQILLVHLPGKSGFPNIFLGKPLQDTLPFSFHSAFEIIYSFIFLCKYK